MRLILTLGVLLVCPALGGWLTWELRRADVLDAKVLQIRLADHAALVLAKHIDIDFLAMEAIRISLRGSPAARLDEAAPHAALFDGIGNIDGIGEVMVTDAAGRVVQSLRRHAGPPSCLAIDIISNFIATMPGRACWSPARATMASPGCR